MRWYGLVIGGVILIASAVSLAAPDLRLVWERSVITPTGLDVIAVLRVAIGLGFVFAATASRAPRTVRVLGVVVIIAGLITPWFGVARAQAVIDWMATAGAFLTHVDAVVGMALGACLLYMFRAPTRRAA